MYYSMNNKHTTIHKGLEFQSLGTWGTERRGLPLIMYTSMGGGEGVNTNAYKCVQGGGGSEHDQKYAFCMQVYWKCYNIWNI